MFLTQNPFPWESDPEKWKERIRKSIGVVLFNILLIIPIFAMGDAFTREFAYKYSMEDWPSLFEIVSQFLFFLFVEDLVFYWVHRSLHHPKLYWIHKKHHEYNITITLAATYAHPIEFVMGNGFPFSIGYVILASFTNVHMVTICCWTVYRYLETCETHSGYEFPWAQMSFLPFKVDTYYHDFHHSMNSGNFCSQYSFWDGIMGTNETYRNELKKKGKND